MLLQFLIVCLHSFARLKTRKTAFKDLYTYPYVEYSKLCTISTYPGRLSNNAATFLKRADCQVSQCGIQMWKVFENVYLLRGKPGQDRSRWKIANLLTPRVWVRNRDGSTLLVTSGTRMILTFATCQKLAASLSWQEVIFNLSKMLKSSAPLYQSQ